MQHSPGGNNERDPWVEWPSLGNSVSILQFLPDRVLQMKLSRGTWDILLLSRESEGMGFHFVL